MVGPGGGGLDPCPARLCLAGRGLYQVAQVVPEFTVASTVIRRPGRVSAEFVVPSNKPDNYGAASERFVPTRNTWKFSQSPYESELGTACLN